jgi:hypothetical protein
LAARATVGAVATITTARKRAHLRM